MTTVREARPDDVAGVLAIYEPLVRDTPISFEEEAPGEKEMVRRIERSHLWLVADDGGSVVGYAYAAPFHPRAAYRWSVEVSIYVAPSHQRKGVARALLERLLADLEDMGLVNAFAGIALPNEASVRLFEQFGFERIALQKEVGFKLRKWHDVGWWQKQLREPTIPPPSLQTG